MSSLQKPDTLIATSNVNVLPTLDSLIVPSLTPRPTQVKSRAVRDEYLGLQSDSGEPPPMERKKTTLVNCYALINNIFKNQCFTTDVKLIKYIDNLSDLPGQKRNI